MQKIFTAVELAFESCGKKCPDTFRSILNQNTNKFKTAGTVEKIQDEIENLLLSCGYVKIYKHFATYRAQRAEYREKMKKQDFTSIISLEINDITTDNGNMNAQSPAGMMMKFASETTKQFSKDTLLAPDVLAAMNANRIYVHDLDYYPTRSLTCVQTPLNKVLNEGMVAGHGEIRGVKHIETAATVAMISLETSQNEMHGGQSIPAFDFYMAPYVRLAFIDELKKIEETSFRDLSEFYNLELADYEPVGVHYIDLAIKRTVRRVHQAMEGFIHNANNIHSRGGNQVVFSSINYGTDTSAEGRLIIREVLKCTMEGVGNGATAIFPIHVFKCKEGVNKNPGDPNYDLYKMSWPVAARRFFPNYLNLDSTFNKDEAWDANDPERYMHEVATMGCRTRTYENGFGPKTSVGRGNLSFTSINLPGLAIETAIETGFYKKTDTGYEINPDCTTSISERIKLFRKKLKANADIVAKQLDDRFKFQSKALAKQFPLLMSKLWVGSEGLKQNDTIESVINQGTLAVSFIGLAEALIMLTGKHHGEDVYSQSLGLELVEYLYILCKGYTQEYGHNYGCFATPAEGLSGRFTVVDRKKYGLIKNVTDKDYYTNSSHVPVWYHCTPQHKAEIECPYHKFETAGHIFYVETDGDLNKNPEYIDAINRMAWKNDCGYNAINHNQMRCSCCNYEPDEEVNFKQIVEGTGVCPKCGAPMSSLSRCTGYLIDVYEKQTFGKKAEIAARVAHT